LPAFFFFPHNHLVSDFPKSLPRQYRTLHVVREAVDADSNRFAFALSSEEPVDQWWGREVLSHDSKAVRQDRLKSGVPLLFNHDHDQHLGVVDAYSIKDGKLRVEGRWSNSPLAQEKKRDFEDNILKDASVGYLVHKIVREQEGEYPSDADTLNVTDWEPLEASLVTVPADPTVGKGRAVAGDNEIAVAVEVRKRELPEPAKEAPAAPAAIPAVTEVRKMADEVKDTQHAAELARRDRIVAIASDKDFSRYVTTDDVKTAIASGASADTFAEQVSRKIVAANDASKVGTAGANVMADLSEKDRKRYSLVRAHRAAINAAKPGSFVKGDDGLEREVSNEIAKRLNKPTAGMYIPNSVERTQTASATGGGLTALTSVVSTVTEASLIEMYRNRARVLALGATRLGGLSGIVRLPRQTAAGTAQWLSETSDTTAADVTTDYVAVTPKRLSIQNKYTIELLAESAPDVENMLANDRSKVVHLAIDLAAINGATGGANPVGVLQTSGLATITSSGTALGSGGHALSYADIVAFEAKVAAANADVSTMGWMFTPETRGLLKSTPMFASGYAMPIWGSNERDPSGLETGPLGYKAGVTNQLPKNLSASSVNNLHAAILGDWSQVIVADYGASEIIVDPYTNAGKGIYVVTERALLDVEIRHIEAFAACLTVAVA
jgi:HK97 family phage major capsid protein